VETKENGNARVLKQHAAHGGKCLKRMFVEGEGQEEVKTMRTTGSNPVAGGGKGRKLVLVRHINGPGGKSEKEVQFVRVDHRETRRSTYEGGNIEEEP